MSRNTRRYLHKKFDSNNHPHHSQEIRKLIRVQQEKKHPYKFFCTFKFKLFVFQIVDINTQKLQKG